MNKLAAIMLAAAAMSQPSPPPGATATERPQPPPRIGVGLGQGPNGEWMITRVVPLSPAHRAGLQAGDLILRVRGIDVCFDDQETFAEAFEPSPVHMTIERAEEGNPRRERLYKVVPKRPIAR
ncbi:MAG: PDZ domain-containing protein [Phycisphaerales bacterium]